MMQNKKRFTANKLSLAAAITAAVLATPAVAVDFHGYARAGVSTNISAAVPPATTLDVWPMNATPTLSWHWVMNSSARTAKPSVLIPCWPTVPTARATITRP